jgi:hypothetical protein
MEGRVILRVLTVQSIDNKTGDTSWAALTGQSVRPRSRSALFAPSVVTLCGDVHDAIPESASLHVNVTVTLVLFQPAPLEPEPVPS